MRAFSRNLQRAWARKGPLRAPAPRTGARKGPPAPLDPIDDTPSPTLPRTRASHGARLPYALVGFFVPCRVTMRGADEYRADGQGRGQGQGQGDGDGDGDR